jgi:2-polyprenyl-6-methoxyphenol hydroxylase-like FAD-dependent oxidoreductase
MRGGDIQTPVLIAGGGLVGMSLGPLLGRFGIDHVIVERSATTIRHPKARGITGRTMELLRVWGIEDRVRAGRLRADVDAEAASLAWSQVYCESGIGRMIGATHPSRRSTRRARSAALRGTWSRTSSKL